MYIDSLANHPDAVSTLARWHHEQWKHLSPGDSIEQRIARLQAHLDIESIPTTFVALSSQEKGATKVVGSASLISHDMDTHPEWTPWLASVFVAPQHRGQGIGTALVRRVIQQARMLGIAQLYLFTTPDKKGFYARLGWSLIERTRYRGYQQIVMVLQVERRKS
jgi:N-acetylglutamate synthase-like GNAT family acetyltransferase